MHKYPSIIGAGEFKAKCLQIMDQVYETHIPVTISKHGKPIAKLIPVDDKAPDLFGAQAGVIEIMGDIITPIDEEWDAGK